tara:strand:+ start:57 stop:359 length:303 start_codon:yes stop_codon:yes gene_type:complete
MAINLPNVIIKWIQIIFLYGPLCLLVAFIQKKGIIQFFGEVSVKWDNFGFTNIKCVLLWILFPFFIPFTILELIITRKADKTVAFVKQIFGYKLLYFSNW